MAAGLEKWVDSLQSRGKYSFLRRQALAESGLSPEAVKKALQRLVRRGRLVKLKNYFYAVVPLEYANSVGLPPSWYIDELMKAMKRPYYVGLLSAAALHGASHHQPQEFQVVTDRFVRSLHVGRVRIRFFANRAMPRSSVVDIKTPTGVMRVSTPEATALDLIRYEKSAGGLDHVASVLAELLPRLDGTRLQRAVRARKEVHGAQRLGFLLDTLRAHSLARPVHAWLERQSPGLIPLRPGDATSGSRPDRRWHVRVGEPIELSA